MVKNVFIKTFLITAGIFVIGFFVGSSLEGLLTSDLQAKTEEIENSIQEIELENLYLLALSDDSCIFLGDIVRKTNNDLDQLAGQLSEYSEENIIFTRDELTGVKKRYSNLLVKAWLLQEGIKENCGQSSVSILYFYDRDCPDCILQGGMLTVLKEDFKESVMIFPFDHSLDVSTIGLLESRYNVTEFPSVVVENATYSGLVRNDLLRESICSSIPEHASCA